MSVRLGADISQFSARMKQVQREFAGVVKASEQMQDVGKTLSLSLSAPLAAIGGLSLAAAADIGKLKSGLVAVSGSAAKAEQQFKRLEKVAELPGLSLEQAVKGSVRLQAAGFSANIAERALSSFGNAIATVGGQASDLEGVSLALSQIAAKGKVSAEEVNQIAERVPQVRKAMQAAFGTSDPMQLGKMGIDAKRFVDGVVTELERLPKAAGGLAGAYENAFDSMKIGAGKVGEAIDRTFGVTGLLTKFADNVKAIGNGFGDLHPAIQGTAVVVAGLAAAIGPLLLGLGSLGLAVPLIKTGLITLSATLATVKTAFIAAAAATKGFLVSAAPIALTVAGITSGVALLGVTLKSLHDVMLDAGKGKLEGWSFMDRFNYSMAKNINGTKDALKSASAALTDWMFVTKEATAAEEELNKEEKKRLGILEELNQKLQYQVQLRDTAPTLKQVAAANVEIASIQALIEKYTKLGTIKAQALKPVSASTGAVPAMGDTSGIKDNTDSESILNGITHQNAALAEQGRLLGIVQPAWLNLTTGIQGAIGPMQETMQTFGDFMQDNLVSAIEGVSSAFGQLFSGEVNGQGFFKSILKQLASFAANYGKVMVMFGIAENAWMPGIGTKKIIAGGALIAASTVAGIALSKSISGGAGVSPVGSSGAEFKQRTAGIQPMAAANSAVTFEIEGTKLVGVLRKQGYKDGR